MKKVTNFLNALNLWVSAITRSLFPKTFYKWYRIDLNLWEEQIKIFNFITYYKYSIWKEGKTHTHIRLKIYPNPTYSKKAYLTKVYVGKKEFEDEYKNNKWLIPINKELDLEMD